MQDYILFNDWMFSAILDGNKTQDRIPINPQPSYKANYLGDNLFCDGHHSKHHDCQEHAYEIKCLYGQVGDKFWVKKDTSLYYPRLIIEFTNLSIKKLKSITIEGIKAEGIKMPDFDPNSDDKSPDPWDVFKDYWDTTYKSKGFGWDKNPYICVREFRKVNNGRY